MIFNKKILLFVVVLLVVISGIFYFRNQVYYSRGDYAGEKMFEIAKGEGNALIASKLEEGGLVSRKIYFYYYLRTRGLLNKIMPGEYQLSGSMTIPEIAHIITNPGQMFAKITFPEGFTASQMADRLTANGFPGEAFLKIVNDPGDFRKRYSYLSDPAVQTLEGYLFPDTYFFRKDITAENITGRLLDTFDGKLDGNLRKEMERRNKTIKDIIIMASLAEKEVQTLSDMKIVTGIFWKRLEIGQRLQSDAPLSYILNDKKDQHSGKELELDSPYNTYRNAGLPPGPISNPGLNAITAAVYPEDSGYNYFFTVVVDGEKKVVYSKTFEEHVANKNKYGL